MPLFNHLFVSISPEIPPQLQILNNLPDFPIHPVWRKDAFRDWDMYYSDFRGMGHIDESAKDIDDDLYERIRPALKLATIFLAKVFPAIVHVYTSPVIDYSNPGEKPYLVLPDSWVPQDEQYYTTLDAIQKLMATYRIMTFHQSSGSTENSSNCDTRSDRDGTDAEDMMDIDDIDNKVSAPSIVASATNTRAWTCAETTVVFCSSSTESNRYFVRSGLNDRWLASIRNDIEWWSRSPGDRARTLVCLADALLHEFIHAIYYHRCLVECNVNADPGKDIIRFPADPHMGSNKFAELGWAVSCKLWGGYIWMDTDFGPRNESNHLQLVTLDTNVQVTAVHEVTTQTVLSLFEPATWMVAGRPFGLGAPDNPAFPPMNLVLRLQNLNVHGWASPLEAYIRKEQSPWSELFQDNPHCFFLGSFSNNRPQWLRRIIEAVGVNEYFRS